MKVEQTKKAKEEFYSPVMSLIKTTRTVEELSRKVGICERKVRDEINGIAKHYAVIRGSFQKGYRMARDFSKLSLEEMEEEAALVKKTASEFNSRIEDMKKPLKPLIAYQKQIEKEIFKRKQKK